MIQLPAILEEFKSLKEPRCYRLKIDTQEVSDEQVMELSKFKGTMGWMLFKEMPIKEQEMADLPEFVPEFKGDKSPAKRLKNVLYVYWDTKTAKKKDFDTFYKAQMEKIIDKVKDSLD